MERLISVAGKTYRHFMHDSLYRNSIILILNSGLVSFVGFIFWVIGSHLFSTSQVGIASTLVSLSTVLALFSYLGLNNSIVRYLPGEKNSNELIDSIFWTVSIAATFMGLIFILGIRTLVPSLSGLQSPIVGGAFLLFCVVNVQNTITDNIFLAKRVTLYIFLANCGLAVCKLALPFILLPFGSSGLFLSHALGVTASTLLSLWFAAARLKYRPQLRINFAKIRKMFSFSVTNYIANFMVSAPPMILPAIVTNKLGPQESAYFYMAMSIATLIYIIPNVTTNAMFAESSHNEKAMRLHVQSSLRLILALIVPVCIVVILGASFILKVFGHAYSIEGAEILRIFSIAALFMTINYISATILQVKLRMPAMVTITTVGAILILVGAYKFAPHSLNDVGWAWLIGQGTMSVLFIGYIIKTVFPIPSNKLA